MEEAFRALVVRDIVVEEQEMLEAVSGEARSVLRELESDMLLRSRELETTGGASERIWFPGPKLRTELSCLSKWTEDICAVKKLLGEGLTEQPGAKRTKPGTEPRVFPSAEPAERIRELTEKKVELLHDYNDLKDAAHILLGRLAEFEGTTVRQLYAELGITGD